MQNETPLLALRPAEAARAIGISRRTLWDMTRAGHIPHLRVGTGTRKLTLYPVADLERWLSEQVMHDQRLSRRSPSMETAK